MLTTTFADVMTCCQCICRCIIILVSYEFVTFADVLEIVEAQIHNVQDKLHTQSLQYYTKIPKKQMRQYLRSNYFEIVYRWNGDLLTGIPFLLYFEIYYNLFFLEQ